MDERQLTEIEKVIFKQLKAHPNGITEYQLLKILHACSEDTLDSSSSIASAFACRFDNELDLFSAHFLLFHILYRLRQRLMREQQYDLEIGPLNIQLQTRYQAQNVQSAGSVTNVCVSDPLMSYYLDISHLKNTTATAIKKLLNHFYETLALHQTHGVPARQQALDTLGLSDPVNDATIKKQYRKLAMLHHPDRGGSTEKLQAINAALSVLLS